MTAPRVLVVGGTGALGRPVVRLLRERGVPVRALARHPD
ncbi:MAG: NmrA family NAD(P)-binding protein, partial [Rubrivivax sp.]|nr:NmrA family NAD(P)-binding protein [Rubrivivax sp.]